VQLVEQFEDRRGGDRIEVARRLVANNRLGPPTSAQAIAALARAGTLAAWRRADATADSISASAA
jgi:hypothetical protein